MPTDIWDSGVRSQGATFTHTFNSAGTFPYYCKPLMYEVGKVIVATPNTNTSSSNWASDRHQPIPQP